MSNLTTEAPSQHQPGESSGAATCSLRLAHAITRYQEAEAALRAAETELKEAAAPFMKAHQDSEDSLTKLSYMLPPRAVVSRRVYERIYQLQDLKANAKLSGSRGTNSTQQE